MEAVLSSRKGNSWARRMRENRLSGGNGGLSFGDRAILFSNYGQLLSAWNAFQDITIMMEKFLPIEKS